LRMLLKPSYQVHTADSVERGLQLLTEKKPDAIVMDIRMPGMTGIEGLRRIRQIDPHLSVIMLTGFGALETAKALQADNVDVAVLHVPTIKPLDTETIIREAKRSGRLVVVAENHTTIGGLGEAVATALLTAGVTPTYRQIALPDAFLDAGALPTLHDRYGISTNVMSATIKGWLA